MKYFVASLFLTACASAAGIGPAGFDYPYESAALYSGVPAVKAAPAVSTSYISRGAAPAYASAAYPSQPATVYAGHPAAYSSQPAAVAYAGHPAAYAQYAQPAVYASQPSVYTQYAQNVPAYAQQSYYSA